MLTLKYDNDNEGNKYLTVFNDGEEFVSFRLSEISDFRRKAIENLVKIQSKDGILLVWHTPTR